MDIMTWLKQKPVLILIYGTSGSGKSTMSRRLFATYNIQNVLSTDTVRKEMRQKISKEDNPILHASTFETGDYLKPSEYKGIEEWLIDNKGHKTPSWEVDPEIIKQVNCVKGYEMQWEMIEDVLINKIDQILSKGESLIVEGVHLSESVWNRLFTKYTFCLPFMIYVSDPEEHKKRFGSRWEGGSIDPSQNRYVKNFSYIRAIQKSIIQNPIDSKYAKINNDNVRTLGVLSTCIRKYIKKLMELSHLHTDSFLLDRRCNLFKDSFEKALSQCQKEDEKSQQISNLTKGLNKEKVVQDTQNFKEIYIRNRMPQNQYWFLKHEKFFHNRTKKLPLVPILKKKRFRSAKKKK